MSKIVLTSLVGALLSITALSLGQAETRSVPVIAAQVRGMLVSEVLRARGHHEQELDAAGLKGLKPVDEVELEKRSDGSVGVKHLPSGQAGVLSAAQ
jgi:hypothetical protein